MTSVKQFDPRQIAAFLLAGGRSRRMGRDKARLQWHGLPLVAWLLHQMRPLSASVTLVVKRSETYADLGLPMIVDSTPDHGLVHGIVAALQAPGPPWRLVLACDMPGVDAYTVRKLWRQAQDAGVGSYPQGGNHHEPLPSLWHHDVRHRIADSWGMRAQDWLRHAGLTPWQVDDDDRFRLQNINTPEQWQAWSDQAAGGTPDG